MTVTWSKFVECVNHFMTVSNSIDDGWSLVTNENSAQSPENFYIIKKEIKKITSNHQSPEHFGIEFEESLDPDLSSVEYNSDKTTTVVWEYHILYSPSYGVPVLYFNVKTTAGKVLSLDEIWATLNVPKEVLTQKWSFVTQQEHPILLRPFFLLHPCKSFEIVKVSENSRVNPLVTWLSSIAHIVHLSVPHEYGKQVDFENQP
jgi:ubiquitin-like-conjugating enzyme ATG10